MSKFFLNILCFGLLISTSNKDVFQLVSNKTWIENEGIAGTSIVFYETDTKLKKAIRQLQGSGVYIVNSEIYDVKVNGNKLVLFDGLNLVTSEKLEEINYYFDKEKEILIRNDKPLSVYFEQSTLYDWINLPNFTGKEIDVNKLKKIAIEENKVYSLNDLEELMKN